jgi:uncharacterized protein (DUF2141 family)
MRALLLMVVLLISIVSLAEEEKITIDVSGINVERGGNLIVLVFGHDGFPVKHEKALLTQTKEASSGRMTFIFNVPPYGELAFKVLHDEDSNNKVTKNWTGIWPGEGLGFSNGAAMSAGGPPSFDAAKISRSEAIKGIAMRVIYP